MTRPTADRSAEKVIILGGGPNRIGQGIEFDYCCVHACFACAELGYETIMVNCNPETVSTDYDTSDRLYFEPLTLEDVLNIVDAETAPTGVIVQFGGQTPLNLAAGLARPACRSWAPRPTPSTWPRTAALRRPAGELDIPSPDNGIAHVAGSRPEPSPRGSATRCWCGPSYVLGGRAMAIVVRRSDR